MRESNNGCSKDWAKLGNIIAETLFLVMFPWQLIIGKLTTVLRPRWLNENAMFWKQRVTRAHDNKLTFE